MLLCRLRFELFHSIVRPVSSSGVLRGQGGDRPSVGGLVRCERVQGAVMMVQNRYQRRRMYTRIALGKNRAMDVVSGETSGGSGQLLILYPLLFALQILQCWIGASGPRPASKGWSMPLLHIFCPFPF